MHLLATNLKQTTLLNTLRGNASAFQRGKHNSILNE